VHWRTFVGWESQKGCSVMDDPRAPGRQEHKLSDCALALYSVPLIETMGTGSAVAGYQKLGLPRRDSVARPSTVVCEYTDRFR
jgi:hypothetical protein